MTKSISLIPVVWSSHHPNFFILFSLFSLLFSSEESDRRNRANISTWVLDYTKMNNTKPPQVSKFNITEFTKLKANINDVFEQSKKYSDSANTHDYHHYVLNYLLLGSMIVIIILYFWHRARLIKNSTRRPRPRPRRRKPDSQVFEICDTS